MAEVNVKTHSHSANIHTSVSNSDTKGAQTLSDCDQNVTASLSEHPAFESVAVTPIPSLNIEVQQYIHRKTRAVHYHIAADHDENVFMVALRTVPENSSGVAHILEHTVLCGSERYPVRDPFFMMIRRSLNTFMNAFTSSDWTAYPFASQNKKDFNNLLQVYLDAVFFAKLDPLDFAQEGHRLEFSDNNNDLEFKGVVYNEMKGAMSASTAILWQTLTKYLNPTNTYHHNSGGDPEHILDLTYEQLRHFYKTHYHPTNAVFMTFGDLPAEHHHQSFEDLALHRFELLKELPIEVVDEKRYYAPIQVKEAYPTEDSELQEKTHIVMGWLLGHSTRLDELLEASFLTSVLLDHSASPLRKVLEQTSLGRSPSPLCGLEDANKEMAFMCGIEGSEPDRVDAFETLVLTTLTEVADNPVSQSTLESVLHQLELSQREIGGDAYPYGMQLMLAGLSGAVHRGSFVDLLNLEPAIATLRERIQSPTFLSELIHKYLLDNAHRVTLTLYPDAEFNTRKKHQEQQRLKMIKHKLSDEQSQAIVLQAEALKERQALVEDESILPNVTLEDVKPDLVILTPQQVQLEDRRAWFYQRGTNGLVYQQHVIPLCSMPLTELHWIPTFSQFVTQLGVNERDYLAQQEYLYGITGGVSASITLRNLPDSSEMVTYFTLSGKALVRNQKALAQAMKDIWVGVRFDEVDRIKDLLSQSLLRKEAGITQRGHMLAMQAASSSCSAEARIAHELTGLPAILNLKQSLAESLYEDKIARTLTNIKESVLGQHPSEYLFIGEHDQNQNYLEQLQTLWPSADHGVTASDLNWNFPTEAGPCAWLVNSQVNFCAKAYTTVPAAHRDAAALTVLGGYLRNGYLHRAIREQGGAYGGGASHDLANGVFKFYSYRDPRLCATFEDFDGSINWFVKEKPDALKLEQAILGVIASLDKPGSPAGEAKQDFHYRLTGRLIEFRQEFRQRVLSVTHEDLVRVVTQYLTPERSNMAVVSHKAMMSEIQSLGLEVHEL